MNILFSALLFVAIIKLGTASSIVPGAYWADTNGVPIQAHGGGFLKLNDVYYWFGEDKTENSHNFRHVNAYSSSNLVSWTFLGHALSATNETAPESEIGPDAVVERPKVIYNEGTRRFVMWFHLDSSNYGLAKIGIASSPTVEGPYTYHGSISPYGEDSRDMTVWVDQEDVNRTAYLVYATRVNLDTAIAKLTPDYLGLEPVQLLKLVGIHREAYAVFKTNGLYYIVMSGATGWDSNPNYYMHSTSMAGPWSEQFQIAPGSSNTHNSQTNYVIPVANGQFIFAGDRWNRYALSDSRYMWLPIQFGSGNSIRIDWMDEWWVSTTSGSTGPISSRTLKADNATASLDGGAIVQPCSGCLNGASVGYVGFGGTIRFDGISANQTSDYSILISYANGNSSPRFASVNLNGAYYKTITFPTTGNGNSVTQIVFQAPLQAGSNNSIEFYNDSAWAPDFDYLKIQCYYVNCT